MTDISRILAGRADVRDQGGERRIRWGDELAVIVCRDGTIGQFACAHPWTRGQIETAVVEWAGNQPSRLSVSSRRP